MLLIPLKSVTSTCHSTWAGVNLDGLVSPTLFNLYKEDVHTHTLLPQQSSILCTWFGVASHCCLSVNVHIFDQTCALAMRPEQCHQCFTEHHHALCQAADLRTAESGFGPPWKFSGSPRKGELVKNLYTKSERLTLSCRVTWAWYERVIFYNWPIIILPRKKKKACYIGGSPSGLPGPNNVNWLHPHLIGTGWPSQHTSRWSKRRKFRDWAC